MPQRKSLHPIPKLESEDGEREFWATHDSADYVDWSRAECISFPSPQAVDAGQEPARQKNQARDIRDSRDRKDIRDIKI